MDPRLGRPAIGKALVAAVLIVVVALAAVAALSLMPKGSLSSSSTSSTETSTAIGVTSQESSLGTSYGGLNVTMMYVDVIGNQFQPPTSNGTFLAANQTYYLGSPDDFFTVTVSLFYADCPGASCPSQVTQVGVLEDGFVVQEVDAGVGTPVDFQPTGEGTQQSASFAVTIEAPKTPYTGIMTVVVSLG